MPLASDLLRIGSAAAACSHVEAHTDRFVGTCTQTSSWQGIGALGLVGCGFNRICAQRIGRATVDETEKLQRFAHFEPFLVQVVS